MTVMAAIDAFRRPSPSGSAPAETDVDAFRAAMRQFASGVCLVAHSVGGAPAGMTATAIASLSLVPPTLIVCLNRASSTYAGLAPGVALGGSVLGADHRELAERFAGRTGEEVAVRERLRSEGFEEVRRTGSADDIEPSVDHRVAARRVAIAW